MYVNCWRVGLFDVQCRCWFLGVSGFHFNASHQFTLHLKCRSASNEVAFVLRDQ